MTLENMCCENSSIGWSCTRLIATGFGWKSLRSRSRLSSRDHKLSCVSRKCTANKFALRIARIAYVVSPVPVRST